MESKEDNMSSRKMLESLNRNLDLSGFFINVEEKKVEEGDKMKKKGSKI